MFPISTCTHPSARCMVLVFLKRAGWSWPFLGYINRLKRRALHVYEAIGKHSNVKVKVNEIFLY